jgi:hypothetical protein
MFSFLNFKKTPSKQSLILMSPASLPIDQAFSQTEPEYADTISTFSIGKRTVSLRLYKNGKIRRFLSSSKSVKERCGREATYRYNNEMEPLFNMSLENAATQTRKELRNMSRQDNIELRKAVKPTKATAAVEAVVAPVIPPETTESSDNDSSIAETPTTDTVAASNKVIDLKKLKGQGKLLSFGISEQTRKKKGSTTNEVEKYSCFCVDIEDKESKATERLLGADLERALTEANAQIGDQVEVYLMAVKQMSKERSKNFYEIRIIN